MQGLIDSAKAKLWDIVNELARAKPSPNLRVGLYSYGHSTYRPADGWVRKEVDLTVDLDEVNKKLFALTINGGEEYVARVSRDALAQQSWSKQDGALKLIFVAGNEPATQDPQVPLPEVASMAKAKGVIINTIYCGRDGNAESKGYRDFAVLTGGRYASIDQDRGTVAIAAPQDKRLAELSARLNDTYVAYGREGLERKQNQAAQDSNAARAGLEAAAARGATKGGAMYRNSAWDLLDRMKEDPKFDLSKLPDDQLPEELRKLKPEERVAYLKKKQAEREALQQEIAELARQREAFIREETKKNPAAGDKAFGAAMRSALREQARAKGLEIPE
jgi:hypothetical protein